MPVSTRSQIFGQEDPNAIQRTRSRINQEDPQMGPSPLRNPHHGLKEKMKALTLLYEQQKRASNALRNNSSVKTEDHRFSTHPNIEVIDSVKKEEKEPKSKPVPELRENVLPNSTITRTVLLPSNVDDITEDTKENVIGFDRIVGFSSCPRKPMATTTTTTVARKLSLGGLVPQSEPRVGLGGVGGGIKTGQDLETIKENSSVGSRILVFVRLRPMAKKEKEAGSRNSVRIVNRRDIYLTEFASENDYLRLKRLRGRHFTFDASFPDTTTQQEVYSTT